jgi:hypothetical protein
MIGVALGVFLALFLLGLALDAQGSDRSRAQPLDADFPPAFLASSVAAVVKAGERLIDFTQQFALAILHPEQKDAVGFERSAVGRVSESFLGRMIHRSNCPLGFDQDVALALFKELTEDL